MGLRCSLLGHDYGESFVERDREERGNEVVVTERELQECARCGAEKISSENTEVRSLEPDPEPESSTPSPDTAASPTGSTDAASDAGDAASDAGDDGGAFTSATDAIEQAESGGGRSDSGFDQSGSATTTAEADVAAEGDDDAVILEDDADDATPGSDQWEEPDEPEVDPQTAPEEVAEHAPEPDDEDVEFVDAGPETDAGAGGAAQSGDASATDAGPTDAGQRSGQPGDHSPSQQAGDAGAPSRDAEAASRADRSRGEWPEHDGEDEGFDADPAADASEAEFQFGDDDQEFVEADTGFTSAGPVDNTDSDGLDFTLFCPECGFERYAAGSSLRAGDICPECKRGYLAEDR